MSHNQDKQSSASQMKLCATQQRLEEVPEPSIEQAGKLCVTQSGQGKLCVSKQPGKKPEPGFEQAEKLCVAQSGQAKLCVTNEALCHTIGTGEALCHKRAGEKEEAVLNKQDEKPSGAVAASK